MFADKGSVVFTSELGILDFFPGLEVFSGMHLKRVEPSGGVSGPRSTPMKGGFGILQAS